MAVHLTKKVRQLDAIVSIAGQPGTGGVSAEHPHAVHHLLRTVHHQEHVRPEHPAPPREQGIRPETMHEIPLSSL